MSLGLRHNVFVFPSCPALNLQHFPNILYICSLYTAMSSHNIFSVTRTLLIIANKYSVLQKTFRRLTGVLWMWSQDKQGLRHIAVLTGRNPRYRGLAWASSYFPTLGKLIKHRESTNQNSVFLAYFSSTTPAHPNIPGCNIKEENKIR